VIYNAHHTQYIFERCDQKLIIFAFLGRFHELLPTVLGFRGDLQGRWHSVHFLEGWPKTHPFCVLGPFSWAIVHSFRVLGWLTRPMTLTTCLRGMTENTSFLRLWPFSWAIATVLGFRGDLQGPWHSVHFWEGCQKTRHVCILGPFLRAIAHSFGVSDWITRSMTLDTRLRGMTKKLIIFAF
jgi:hypothetical protein